MKTARSSPTPAERYRDPVVWLVAIVAIVPFLPALRNGLVWDDYGYVAGNPIFSLAWPAAIGHAFRSITMGNWHPLTLLSLRLDHALGVTEPLIFHLTNLLLHGANALLVHRTLLRISGARWPAVGAALLWAAHPLRVESVAWISERKDLLYVLFFLLALLSYVTYAKDPARSRRSYAAALGCFAASTLSKAMGVSLVPVLFLVDWLVGRRASARTIAEKVPFAVAGITIGWVAIKAQVSGGAVPLSGGFGLATRAAYACHAITFYLVRSLAPLDLCGMYRYPARRSGGLPGEVWASVGVTAILAVGSVAAARKSRVVGFGLGMALATVALVLQLLPVGVVFAADRYTYLPAIGLSVALTAALARFRARSARTRLVAGAAVAAAVVALGSATWARCRVWHDDVSFWSDVLAKDPGNVLGHQNLGVALEERGDVAGAVAQLDLAVRITPDDPDCRFDRALALGDAGRWDEALADLTKAIQLKPDFAAAYLNRGLALERMGRAADGARDVRRAIELGFAVDPAVAARFHLARAPG